MMLRPDLYAWFVAEIHRRPFKLSARRVLVKLVELTHAAGKADLYVARLEDLAAATGDTKNNLRPIVQELVMCGVLGREERTRTWWVQPPELWGYLVDDVADAATASLARQDDERRRQAALIPAPISDAEWAAEAEIQPPKSYQRAEIQPPTEIQPPKPLPACARAPEPGNQKPDNQVVCARGTGAGLDRAGWSLLRDLEAWCAEVGESSTTRQRQHWGWRVWTQPVAVEWSLLQARRHVAEGRPCRSRFGLIKKFWRDRTGDDRVVAPASRSADRLHGQEPTPQASAALPSASLPGVGAPSPDQVWALEAMRGVKAKFREAFFPGKAGAEKHQ